MRYAAGATGLIFRDFAVDHLFADEITWLAGEDNTTAYTDRAFRPLNRISREATAAFLFRLDHLTS